MRLSRPALLALGFGLVFAEGTGLGCDVTGWLGERGVATFEEVKPAEARRLAAEPGAVVVAVRPKGGADLAGPADVLEVAPDAPLPAALAGPSKRPVVVLAADPRAARRLAARLVRVGRTPVTVVGGGLNAWRRADASPASVRVSPEPGAHLSSPITSRGHSTPATERESWRKSQK